MKKIIIAILLCASTAFANGDPELFANGSIVQGCAFDGTQASLLTLAGTNIDNQLYACFATYAPADYKIRFSATSGAAGNVQIPVIGGNWSIFVVNKATPFARISSATGGYIIRNTQRKQ
jgi:hypothetical protein